MLQRLTALLLLAAAAFAGGGPETTLVVVNGKSAVSRRIADEYVRLRDIPESHVVSVEGIPHLGVVPLDLFLERIWKPVQAHMAKLGIEDQIDLITYSADFPYAVDIRARTGGRAQASLTGVTYLIRQVLAEHDFWDLEANRYYRVRFAARRATADERALATQANGALQAKQYAQAAQAFRKLLATYEDAPSLWYNFACCLALLGETREALDALEKAAARGFDNPQHAANDADLVSIREHTRFGRILKKMREGGGAARGMTVEPAQGFASTRRWGGADEDRYYLSTQLAYTGRFGNSVPEVLAYLRAAALSDGTRPNGTVYVCKNKDIRSRTRAPFVPALVADLKKRGRKVRVQEGVVPVGADDVIGAVVGKATFDWGKSKSRMLPGAICEHLTSFGAHFGTPGQTKISEFFRHGAAGSSGTIVEPLAIHQKFPHPHLHVFYADGCSLAEAFYQSVSGPFQLMVAGDGLARPFARFLEVRGGNEPRANGKVKRFELWVDGRRVATGDTLEADTAKARDVRIVAIADDAVETRSYVKLAGVRRPEPPAAKQPIPAVEPPTPLKPGVRGADVVTNLGDKHAGPPFTTKKDVVLDGWFEVKETGWYQLYVHGAGTLTLKAGEELCKDAPLNDQLYFPLTLEKGWHPLRLELKSQGSARVEVMLGGHQVLAPLALKHFSFPLLKTQPKLESNLLVFKRATKDIAAVTLYPKKGQPFATAWKVETHTGYGKWKPVKDLQIVVAWPSRTRKGQVKVPLFVELVFGPARAKKVRLTPEGAAEFDRFEVLGKR